MAVRPISYQNEAASIATNSYSIASKRSVELLYFHREKQYLHAFVPNFKRRAPLINRGYWLRTRAIESKVESFLARECAGRKVVVNLGSGYDVLPFRMRTKGVGARMFVDIDYPDLISRKSRMVERDRTCKEAMGSKWRAPWRFGRAELVSDWYRTVGCDLADLESLDRALAEILLASESVLFVAEVSITYMPCQKADALVQWAAKFKNAEFCLLEQYLPAGASHPFAEVMLRHFAKQTPLQSINRYPLLRDQELRFLNRGWKSVRAQSLWDVWEDDRIIPADQRLELDTVEQFDEWEEFILFASHYVFLEASNSGPESREGASANTKRIGFNRQPGFSVMVTPYDMPKRTLGRRFAAPMKLCDGSIRVLGGSTICSGTEIYHNRNPTSVSSLPDLPAPFCSFTVSEASPRHHLLVGGRRNPSHPLSGCYVYEEDTKTWWRTHGISPARFRHCAAVVTLDSTRYVLVYGGRSVSAGVLSDWQLWNNSHGWIPVHCAAPVSLFGAAMVATASDGGILLGGLDGSLKISRQVFSWRITSASNSPEARFAVQLDTLSIPTGSISRFGATLQTSSWGTLLVGGVGRIPHGPRNEIMALTDKGAVNLLPESAVESLRSFIGVGCSVSALDSGGLLITGGGAVCFSFGSSFNPCWLLVGDQNTFGWRGDVIDEPKCTAGASPPISAAECVPESSLHDISSTVLSSKTPCIVRNVAMGACTARWDTRYLEDKIGAATVISIHKGSSKYLQFSTKNFVYQTVPFSQFRAHLEQNDHVYLRSLAARSPFRKAADFWTDFPGLAVDFTLPAQLSTICDLPANLHSSVLRVSGNVAIWLHYDVMSNFLFQARGSKTVVLFQPEDATRLDFAPGSTVSSTCLETIAKSALDRTPADPPPSVNGCAAKVVRLRAGDVLFIPRFCPHATFPAPGDDAAAAVSVAVNVFWRDLPRAAYAAGRDVYGSRDLAAYGAGRDAVGRLAARVVAEAGAGEQAREQAGLLAEGLRTGRREAGTPPAGWAEVCSVRNRVACLPEDVGKFYLPRLAGELVALVEEKLSGNETA